MRWSRTAKSASPSPTGSPATVALLEPDESLFLATADEVTAELAGSTGVATWLVNRRSDAFFTVLSGASVVPTVSVGTALPWVETLCSAMVLGEGPHIAPDVIRVAAYAEKPATAMLGIGAYVGVPLVTRSGELLGTVCGIASTPLPLEHLPSVDALQIRADNLTTALQRELNTVRAARTADAAACQNRDDLTGLTDRRGWGMLLAREEARGVRYAEPAGVLVLDLGAVTSAKAIRRASAAASEAARDQAVIARLGSRQLGMLCAGRDRHEVEAIAVTISDAVRRTGCTVTVGWAARTGVLGLSGTWQLAEERLMVARRQLNVA